MRLFDSHCHLQFPQYDSDRDVVLSHMREKEMGALVVGTDIETSRAGVALAREHDFLWAAVGLHPNDNLDEIFDAAAYRELAQDPKVVAIGECGLDYFRTGKTAEEKAAQKKRFEAHIALAEELNKALVIHCRDAHEDCCSVLQNTAIATRVPVIIHFFSGTADIAKQYLELGCYLSFAGPVTFTEMYDESIALAPIEKILIETDAPFASPAPYRGKRNEPAYVEEVAKKIASIQGVPIAQLMEQTAANAAVALNLPL